MKTFTTILAWIFLSIPIALMILTFIEEGLPHQFIREVWKEAKDKEVK